MKLQVDKNHYFGENYVTKERWANYYHQINNTLRLNPKKVLVIGVGDGITPKYLKEYGIKTIKLDFNPKLKTDIVADIRSLPKKLKKEKFDVIICTHVLENLPFKYFDKILKDFSKITSYLVLQPPSSILQIKFNFAIQPHVLNKNFIINIPILFWKKLSFNGQHYWKLHRRNESMIKLKKVIKKYFTIKKLYQCPENHSLYNFILQSSLTKND